MSKIWVNSSGCIYSTDPHVPVKIEAGMYQLCLSPRIGLYLSHVGESFKLPEKIYDVDKTLIDRIVKSFNQSKRNLGVLLNGMKGSGKTFTAKIICNELKLPVIMISENLPGIPEFINTIDFDCVILVDEYEKVFTQDTRGVLLSCMDGVQVPKQKCLYLLTTNHMFVNENLLNRLSRIRYVKEYGDLTKDTITEIVQDRLKNVAFTDDTIEVISKMDTISIDSVIEIIDESNLYNEKPSAFISILNCNRSVGKKYSYNYQIVDAKDGTIYHEKLELCEPFTRFSPPGSWIYDKGGNHVICLISITGEKTFMVTMVNPAYKAWDEAWDEVNNKDTEVIYEEWIKSNPAPEKHIKADVFVNEIQTKHWAFS